MGRLFGPPFMTLGPIRGIAAFGPVGKDDAEPEMRALARRAAAVVAGPKRWRSV